ncbi:hypothetical protein ASD11_01365 [Aeromicrobium sp. Root495]|uniref:hypothetical protein n=1 Tax=Aeromicrobium sp. Root495 TaxID=1736550 RepID=UPI0007022EA0|nr:hypothetical protein [Aeromicrobium sp. Root495]KQY58344.1 hypothetical protein ASD11_01365 [Aeromicrobium sp. Root495]
MTRRSDRTPEELPALPIPSAVQHLNYPGDVRGQLGTVMGPMLPGEGIPKGQLLTVVEETYDLATDTTRLGLTYGEVQLSADGAA